MRAKKGRDFLSGAKATKEIEFIQKDVRGVVKWFDDRRGHGFICYDGGEAFVHYKHIQMTGRRTLVKGQPVSFDIVDYGRGPSALKVRPLPNLAEVLPNNRQYHAATVDLAELIETALSLKGSI